VAINSIPQQDVANGNGQIELALANPMASSTLVEKKPCPSSPAGGGVI
jgi:hypothetical protein